MNRILDVLPPPPYGALLRRPRGDLPFPLGHQTRLYALGRHALARGVAALGLGAGDEVLVPSYHCGSEIEALERSGLACRFYHDRDLVPDESGLEAGVGPRTRALYLIHYLGFPQDSSRWRRWCDERGLLLLEDAAQAWLATRDGQPVGSTGDLAIFSFHKTFGVPDGAALVLQGDPADESGLEPRSVRGTARRHAGWFLTHSRVLAPVHDRLARGHEYNAVQDFALGEPVRPSRTTLFLLPRIADGAAAASRRVNYETLLEALGAQVPEPFRTVPVGASPFVFPVEAETKRELIDRLAAKGIRAVDFWSQPHRSLPAGRFPDAARRRARTVGLPVHQELRPDELERIVDAAARSPGRARPALKVETVDGLDDLREEWNALAERSGNLFATWEWATTWWRHFGDGHELRTALCRDGDGGLVAILPLYLGRVGPVRLLRFVGHGPGDQLGPVCEPRDRPAAARALRSLLGRGGWDVFLAEELPGAGAWGPLIGGRVLRREGSPLLDIERAGSWDDFLSTLSTKMRKNIRYHERRLAKDHELRFRTTHDPAGLAADLDMLFRLHRAHWGDRSAFTGRNEPFHRDFAAVALERGWLRLSFLELDGRAVAALYDFRYAGAELDYQGGRDPAWDRYSVGFVMLVWALRRAFEEGLGRFRMLRGAEDWKYHFASADPGLETLALARGAVGEAALASGRTALALRRALRARRA